MRMDLASFKRHDIEAIHLARRFGTAVGESYLENVTCSKLSSFEWASTLITPFVADVLDRTPDYSHKKEGPWREDRLFLTGCQKESPRKEVLFPYRVA